MYKENNLSHENPQPMKTTNQTKHDNHEKYKNKSLPRPAREKKKVKHKTVEKKDKLLNIK